MLFNQSGDKRKSKHARARVESCVNTILELNRQLGEGKIRPEIIRQFRRLKETVKHLSDEAVYEEDIYKIEELTNDLLADIRCVCGDANLLRLYSKNRH